MKENQQKVYNFFKEKGLNDTAIAGIMGNLEQESGMMSNNLQKVRINKPRKAHYFSGGMDSGFIYFLCNFSYK